MCIIQWVKTNDLINQTLEQLIVTFCHSEILSSDKKL